MRQAVLAAALAALLSPGAVADLVGQTHGRATAAGKSDEALLEANPILEHLAREHPQALRAILDRLRAPVREPSRRRATTLETEAESAVLDENPDLAALYRESPEAALDLLRLIREAAREN